MNVYIHIPFCKKKCIYCDFYSVSFSNYLIENYLEAIKKEAILRKKEFKGESINSIYLGGGTPSLLNIPTLVSLFDFFETNFTIGENVEITFEANPDDITDVYVYNLRKYTPINRISIGVQSFVDKELAFIHRRHNAQEARRAIELFCKQNYKNINIDLIYSLPNQTLDSWKYSLEIAFSYIPSHLSAYNLIFEQGTPLYKMKENGILQESSDEISEHFFFILQEKTEEKKYLQYEISNFARDGKYSYHNSSYWTGKAYIGLGVSSHSYDGKNIRSFNEANLKKYMLSISNGIRPFENETLTAKDRINEYLLTSLRTCNGLSLKKLNDFSSQLDLNPLMNEIKKLESIFLLDREYDKIFIPKDKYFISDGIISRLLFS